MQRARAAMHLLALGTRSAQVRSYRPARQPILKTPVAHRVRAMKSLGLKDIMFATPDVGGIKRARNFAKFFNAELAVCDKHRREANKIESMRLIGEVQGKDVILVDDLVDTAGTICKAAALIQENGAKSVRAVCTHPVLSGEAYEKIEKSALAEMVVSDTIPLRKESDKIKVLSVSDLFAKAIRKIHDNESISSLFIKL
jgi:ribose-phosphate pyrophosphokinase